MSKKIFISADHGMAIIYFLQSDVVATLLEAGIEIVVLTDDETKDRIAQRFARPGLTFEGLRLTEANKYASTFRPRVQWLLTYLRRVRGSWRFNRRFGLGLAGYGWAGASDDQGRTVYGGYSGVMLEYVFNPGAAYQVATASVIGGGGYCAERKRESCSNLDGFFASDTTLNLEHQLVEHLRIAVGAGYRFAQTGHGGALSSEDLRGFVGRVSFQIGEM